VSSADSPILVVRLGAMGDIIHTLPAVTSLKRSFPERRLVWVVAPKWMPLLEGNPHIDELLAFERGSIESLTAIWRKLRQLRPGLAIDFQGLLQSALVGRVARPREYVGLDKSVTRESLAAKFYSKPVLATGPHRVERNLQLAEAAGATQLTDEAWIPPGRVEGELPVSAYILASPFAGWASKQWPLVFYDALGERLKSAGLTLVANVPAERRKELEGMAHVRVHVSSIPGLIDATRRAVAVIGVDSGPLHLAAALGKPGVALYGPTDPAQTGPFKSRMIVLRSNGVETTYNRDDRIHPGMLAIDPSQVADALTESIAGARLQSCNEMAAVRPL
jgi:heptosyltransferase I